MESQIALKQSLSGTKRKKDQERNDTHSAAFFECNDHEEVEMATGVQAMDERPQKKKTIHGKRVQES